MDIFFSLFSKSSVTLLTLIKNGYSDNKCTSLFYADFSEKQKGEALGTAEFIPYLLLRMVKDGGWKPTADFYNIYLVPMPVCATG